MLFYVDGSKGADVLQQHILKLSKRYS